jgi:hypothetical protein
MDYSKPCSSIFLHEPRQRLTSEEVSAHSSTMEGGRRLAERHEWFVSQSP